MSKTTVLIVEDDRELREALSTTIKLAGMNQIEAESAEAALSVLEKRNVDVVVSDVNMPGMNGHELLSVVKEKYPGIPMMLITAYGQIRNAVAAMQAGAADYLVKPFEPQALIDSLEKIIVGEVKYGRSKGPVAEDPFTVKFFQMASKVAESDSTVLICGESGTGKEVLARYIHSKSARKDAPFVAINCAAIPENMLEAMLFGHEKGAFTGAYSSSPGKFELANGGTILLDEVSEMDLGLQAKLLRVLQEREVERVGGRKPIPLDVRVLATTNRELKEYVQEGKLREDLYYRLSVFPMKWKPLRERPMDIWPLAKRLLKEHSVKMRKEELVFADDVKSHLMQYEWPGNVRELDNAVQRALIMASGGVVKAADFCLEMESDSGWADDSQGVQATEGSITASVAEELDTSALGKDLKLREFQIIIDTLRQENGKKKQAAEKLGISPRTLRYKLAQMRESGIDVAAEIAA